MTTHRTDRLLTADELFELPDDGNRYELVQGRLVRIPPEFLSSGLVAATLLRIIGTFVHVHGLGVCVGEAAGIKIRTNPDTVRAPDLTFLSHQRLPAGGVPPRWYPTGADLVVQVLSPTDRTTSVIAKAEEYLTSGVRLVWVIDPDARAAIVFHPNAAPVILRGDAALDGEDVLPGFTLPLPELWEGLAPQEEPLP